jgi:ABC-type uncharacterized transport system permease subunit
MSNVIMNAEHVMLELCVVMCFVAMMGSVLPPCKAWDEEVRELTTLILNQAWCETVTRLDHEDDRMMQSMWSALARFAISTFILPIKYSLVSIVALPSLILCHSGKAKSHKHIEPPLRERALSRVVSHH